MPKQTGPSGPSGAETKQQPETTLTERVRRVVIGRPRDPLSADTRRHITLVALLAWVGLGADGLSSSAYGPEIAFRALGEHTAMALFLAIAIMVTVFVIAVSYNQVIELFPSGGGGYKVASRLLGPRAGLVAGSALVVDYVLTIAISIAAGVDAVFSVLPVEWAPIRVETALLALFVLIVLNLRGVRESISVLLPIFLGFVVTHVILIVYGIGSHADRFDEVLFESVAETGSVADSAGLIFVLALFLRAYGMGGATYTGIEAVSNSVNMLREPRVRTGKWTMFYMAASLAFTAGGIMFLYLLWDVAPQENRTLNAAAFSAVTANWQWGGWDAGAAFVALSLALEAGLLFVAANTGFLGGPNTLANMAADDWVPHRFAQLSDRLVTANGVLLMGLAALVVLLWSGGAIELLVVLYSMNVFAAFSLTLLGLCVYWWRRRGRKPRWALRFGLSAWGLVVTASIFIVMLIEKTGEGAAVAVGVTVALVAFCALVSRHYRRVRRQLDKLDAILARTPGAPCKEPPVIDEAAPTAVFFVTGYRGVGLHSLLNVQRLFPGRFRNFVFVSIGEVDSVHIKGDAAIERLKRETESQLDRYVEFCCAQGMAAVAYAGFGTDPAEVSMRLVGEVRERFPKSVFFAGTLVFREENFFTRLLHNYTALAIQHRLHLEGVPLVIMPLKVERDNPAEGT